MKITVCVPTVRPTTLMHTVRSILAQTWTDWELLVVGQGASPALAEAGRALPTLDSRIRYLHLDERGLSRARNAALRVATGEIIAMTDDDCEAAPDWLETLARLFTEHPDVGMIGGALLAPPLARWRLETCLNFIPTQTLYLPDSGQTPPPAWGWIGGDFAMRKATADRVGLFDEYLGAGAPDFPAAEDTDYNMRTLAASVGVLCSPDVVVRHTYGVRRGIRQNLTNIWAYARGNGGLDGKLTLAGDPHGRDSKANFLPGQLSASLHSGKLYHIPLTLVEAWYYHRAYRKCLQTFTLAPDGRLTPISATTPTSARDLARTAAR
ncbi:MAG TPA: glycosyltransferase [Ktedonobacterales bacterium]|jgi:glycosyltransferase involved in cell wall biosynthesis